MSQDITEEEFRKITEKVNDEIDAGEHECPVCENPIGLLNSVSCHECGHIPEEHRLQ